METRHSGDEMEIDLREIFFALKKKSGGFWPQVCCWVVLQELIPKFL